LDESYLIQLQMCFRDYSNAHIKQNKGFTLESFHGPLFSASMAQEEGQRQHASRTLDATSLSIIPRVPALHRGIGLMPCILDPLTSGWPLAIWN
jgi:hypothetical protein